MRDFVFGLYIHRRFEHTEYLPLDNSCPYWLLWDICLLYVTAVVVCSCTSWNVIRLEKKKAHQFVNRMFMKMSIQRDYFESVQFMGNYLSANTCISSLEYLLVIDQVELFLTSTLSCIFSFKCYKTKSLKMSIRKHSHCNVNMERTAKALPSNLGFKS